MCSRDVPGSCDCGDPLLMDVLNTKQICTVKCIRYHNQRWVDQCPNSDNSPSVVECSAGALGHDPCLLKMPGLPADVTTISMCRGSYDVGEDFKKYVAAIYWVRGLAKLPGTDLEPHVAGMTSSMSFTALDT